MKRIYLIIVWAVILLSCVVFSPSIGIADEAGGTAGTTKAEEPAKDETITAEEFDVVFDAMREGDFKKAKKNAELLIDRDSPGQRYLIARMRYIYIYTLMVAFEKDELSMSEVTEKLNPLRGKMILQPWHPIRHDDKQCLNMICNDPDWDNTLFTTQTNRDRNAIYWYEYVNTGKHLDLSSYDGKMARMGGILDEFSFNEDLISTTRSNVDWFLRIMVKDGYVQYNR